MSRRGLVLLTLVLLPRITAGCAAAAPVETPRDSLWILNARVPWRAGTTTIRIDRGRIASIGEAPGPGRSIDARSGLVVPGFYDAHVHLLSAGLEQGGVQLASLDSLEGVLAAVGSFARLHPDAPWIEGSGWQYSIVPRGTFPGRRDLDRVVPDRPVILSSFDGHSAWANSRALAVAGVDSRTRDPSGGKIVREPDGSPGGTLLENAAGLVEGAAPHPSRGARRAALALAAGQLAAFGVTSIDDIETDETTLELLKELEDRGELPIRVRVGLPLDGDLVHYAELRKRYASSRLRFGFLKGFVDGVVESRTAYLVEPYAGSTERGEPVITRERLVALVGKAHAAGFPVALHAIGDAAVRLSLDAFETAIEKYPTIHLEHRIEHVEVLAKSDLPRFARLGVRASMQPSHALPEPETEVWSTNLGPERLVRTFPWRDLLDARAHIIFGSDWPVASPDPLPGLAVAATRRDRDGQPPGGWNAHEAISVAEALRAYTVEPALAAGVTDLGILEPGALADLAILSSAVDLGDPRTFWVGRVEHTIVDGALVSKK